MKAQVWENVEFGYSSKEGEMMAQHAERAAKGSEEDIEKAAKALMEDLTKGEEKLDKAVEEAGSSSTPPPSS